MVITLPASVDMRDVPLPATARLVQYGEHVQVICRNDVTPDDAAAMVAALPKVHQARVAQAINDHNAMVTMLQAASTRRIPFAPLPQMVMLFDGEWQLVESETLVNIAGFSLLGEAVTSLPAYDPRDVARVATLDITSKQKIQIELDSQQLALDGVSTATTELDLLTDLANEVSTIYTVPGELDGYLARVLQHLKRDPKHTLTSLVRHKRELAKAIATDIAVRTEMARKLGFSKAMALDMFSEPSAGQGFRHEFTFHPDRYSARPPYYDGEVRFKKHYYPLIHDLKSAGEEYDCAIAIESLPEVDKWVRNIEKDRLNSFWLPTSTDYFYPDFVCQLTDRRLLVVEYKGGFLTTADDAVEKEAIGKRWAATSQNGRCVFVQVSKGDPLGRSLTTQLRNAIAGP